MAKDSNSPRVNSSSASMGSEAPLILENICLIHWNISISGRLRTIVKIALEYS